MDLAIRRREDSSERERLGQSFGVLDRVLNLEMSRVRTSVAFNNMHRVAVRLTGAVQPGPVVETNRVDHQGVAIPGGDRVSVPTVGIQVQIVSAPVHKESAIAVSIAF